ncbi:MAG: CapA family protein [Chloroflexota bacterium]|nr:CapA family protein [Chloroflexota bacterium]
MADVSLYAVGDVSPDREDPESLLALAAPVIRQADIAFAQLETNLSERGTPQLHMLPGLRSHPRNVAALTQAGFHVVSFASNHTLDWGEEALLDTIEVVRQNNIRIIGVGRNIAEARQPAILERKGTRVAFLAYNSVLPAGYEARADKSGCVPLRAYTSYGQVDWQAGTPPRIVTTADKDDLAAMVEDIRKVREGADVVVMSIHWGVHYIPSVIAMYQREVGHAAIEAGVDLILGHHAHILKGIEVYRGKTIFYSLCNFGFDSPITHRSALKIFYGLEPDPEYPTYYFPADSRKTILVKCLISAGKISRVSFLPFMINKKGQPEPLPHRDKRSDEIFHYMEWLCRDQKLDTSLRREGDEVVVAT